MEPIRAVHNAFSCYDTISRGTVRRILEKYGLFLRNAAKSQFEEEKQVFSFKTGYQYAQEAVLLSIVVFTEFFEESEQDLMKMKKSLSSDKRPFMF